MRLDRGFSQPQVAKVLKVSINTVTFWETNRCEPTAKFAKRIIEFLQYVPFYENKSLGKRLYMARLVSGKTQAETAELMDVDESNLRRIELDTQKPFQKTRKNIEGFIRDVMEKFTD